MENDESFDGFLDSNILNEAEEEEQDYDDEEEEEDNEEEVVPLRRSTRTRRESSSWRSFWLNTGLPTPHYRLSESVILSDRTVTRTRTPGGFRAGGPS